MTLYIQTFCDIIVVETLCEISSFNTVYTTDVVQWLVKRKKGGWGVLGVRIQLPKVLVSAGDDKQRQKSGHLPISLNSGDL